MSVRNAKAVTITNTNGVARNIPGLYRRECGTFTVRSGAVSKTFTDYEYSADFTYHKQRHRTVLCKESDFRDEVTFNRATGQWDNPALDHACEKLEVYRRNAEKGVGPTGREEEKEFAKKQRQAEEERQRIKEEADQRRQSLATARSKTISELVDDYDKFVKPQLKAYASIRGHLHRIRADLGNIRLRDLTLRDLEEWRAALSSDNRQPRSEKSKEAPPLSPTTVNRYIQTFKAMMTKACDWKWISERRLKDLRKIRLADERHNRRQDFLSRVEVERLVNCADPSIRPIIICATQTGMRKGEILGLKWPGVDLTHRVINLSKTKSGDPRSIPINDRLDATLRGLVRSLTDEHVFLNPETGKRWYDLKTPFARAVKKAKLSHRGIVFHHLRHTAASWMVMGGVPLATVAEILGHADIQMVMRYAHLAKGHLDAATAILAGGGPPTKHQDAGGQSL